MSGDGAVEALQRVIIAYEADYGSLEDTSTEGYARALLASDWLRDHDAEVRRETAERIAQAIEDHAANCGRTGPHHTTFATAVRIAREEASRG